jgi:hypothetical protein
MEKRSRPAKPQQTTTHPEAPKHTGRGVPDESSSKAISTKQRDGRNGHDKDGNQAQGQPARRRSR